MSVKDRSYIRTGNFIFENEILKQEVTVIRHKPTPELDVGIHTEYHAVKVDGKIIRSPYSNSMVRIQSAKGEVR